MFKIKTKTPSSIKEKIKAVKKEKIDSIFLSSCLNHVPNFLGTFAQNDLMKLRHVQLPFSLIVNVDYSDKAGSHWLSIYVSRHTIEIFDSLGFDPKFYSNSNKLIINFIEKYSFSRHIFISPVLQPTSSTLCGLYCIYFVLMRQFYNFQKCLSRFGSNHIRNDQRLSHFFNSL